MLSINSGATHYLSRRHRQRQRLMRLYVFAMIVNLVIGMSQGITLGTSATVGLIVCAVITVGCIGGFLCAYYQWHCVMAARGSLYLTSLSLSVEIALSGGLSGYVAPILVLMPLMCALVLGTRDTITFTLFSIMGVGILFLNHASLPTYVLDPDTFFISSSITIVWAMVGAGFVALMLVRDGEAAEMQLKRLVELQTHFALHDSLTGLGNRAAVHALLGNLDVETDRVDLFVIDLDGFKQINDQLGHGAGDDVLVTVAERLKKVAAKARLVARLGGDEFLIAMDAPKAAVPAHFSLGQRLVDALTMEKGKADIKLQVSASVGSARFPVDSNCTSELLSKADAALYEAKEAGKRRYVRCSPPKPMFGVWNLERAAS